MSNNNKTSFLKASSEASRSDLTPVPEGCWESSLRSGGKVSGAQPAQRGKPRIARVETVTCSVNVTDCKGGKRTGAKLGPRSSSKGTKGHVPEYPERPETSREGKQAREDETPDVSVSDVDPLVHGVNSSLIEIEEARTLEETRDEPRLGGPSDTIKRKFLARSFDSEMEEEEITRKRERPLTSGAYAGLAAAKERHNEALEKEKKLKEDRMYAEACLVALGGDRRALSVEDLDYDIDWGRDGKIVKERISEAPTADITAELLAWLETVQVTNKKCSNMNGVMKKMLNLAHRIGSVVAEELGKRARGTNTAAPAPDIAPVSGLIKVEKKELEGLRRQVASLQAQLEEAKVSRAGVRQMIPSGSVRLHESPLPRATRRKRLTTAPL